MRTLRMIVAGLVALLAAGQGATQIGVDRSESELIRLDRGTVAPGLKSRGLVVQLGDSTKAEYEPSFQLTAWDGEVALKVRLGTDPHPVFKDSRTADTLNGEPMARLTGEGREHELFLREDGNFEWNLVLTEEPTGSNFSFPIETRGLEFWYQPPLGSDTLEYEVDSNGDSTFAGAVHQPDSVAGSYAVYHATGRNNRRLVNGVDTTYEVYEGGKAFHIYRPRVWDTQSDTTWGFVEVRPELNLITVGVDSVWLHDRERVYPVTIDPTIGKTTVGGSSYYICSSDRYRGLVLNAFPTGGGTGDSMTIHCVGTGNAGAAVYRVSDGVLIDSSTTTEDMTASPGAWLSFASAMTPTYRADSVYCVGGLCNSGTGNISFDFSIDMSRFYTGSWPPASPVTLAVGSRNISAYITYTVGSTPATATSRRRHLLEGE